MILRRTELFLFRVLGKESDRMANVSKEELLHIARLADLNIKEDEIDNYLEKLVCQNVEVPESFEKAMREALFSEKFYKRLKKRKMTKLRNKLCKILLTEIKLYDKI